MKLGNRLYGSDEREVTAIDSMMLGTVGGDSKIGMPIVETRRSPLVVTIDPCPYLVSAVPPQIDSSDAFPRAINAAGDEVYATRVAATSKVSRFTWPDLTFIADYAAYGSVSGIDVAIAPNGDVFVTAISGTTLSLIKNGSTLQAWTRTGVAGGGVAYADGWVWVVVNGTSASNVYRVDPSTGAITGIDAGVGTTYFKSYVIPATDGAIWYGTSTYLARYKSGSTASDSINVAAAMIPRPDGNMLVYNSTSGAWVQYDATVTPVTLPCDPDAEGVGLPLSSFYDPALSIVGMQDNFDQVWAYP